MAGERGSGGVDPDGSGRDDGSAGDRRERTYRGISLRAATGYLEGLGGETVAEVETVEGAGDDDGPEDATTETDDTGTATDGTSVVAGDRWRATLSSDTVDVGPTLHLTEVTVVFEGDPPVLDDVVEDFSRKALRAGG